MVTFHEDRIRALRLGAVAFREFAKRYGMNPPAGDELVAWFHQTRTLPLIEIGNDDRAASLAWLEAHGREPFARLPRRAPAAKPAEPGHVQGELFR